MDGHTDGRTDGQMDGRTGMKTNEDGQAGPCYSDGVTHIDDCMESFVQFEFLPSRDVVDDRF